MVKESKAACPSVAAERLESKSIESPKNVSAVIICRQIETDDAHIRANITTEEDGVRRRPGSQALNSNEAWPWCDYETSRR